MKPTVNSVIGIIPAAGSARRMGGIPKMLLPIPMERTLIHRMIALMEVAQPRYLDIVANGVIADLLVQILSPRSIHLEYTDTMSQTVLSCQLGRYAGDDVLFGMPDTYFDDDQAFVKLAAALDDGADVAVGVFQTRPDQHQKLGMCDINFDTQQITQVRDKPQEAPVTVWAWGVLAWKPTFWSFIRPEDPHVGYALPRAIAVGLDVRAVLMEGEYFDTGTPDEYFECIEHLRSKAR